MIEVHDTGKIGKKVWPDMLAFMIGLGTTYWFEWQTGDLVWSLWLSSLFLVYLTSIVVLISGGYLLIKGVQLIKEGVSKEKVIAGAFFFIVVSVFLVFFTFIIGGIHAIYSDFINHFFPVESLPENGLIDGMTNPFILWELVFVNLFFTYGIFIVATTIAERNTLLLPLSAAQELVKSKFKLPRANLLSDENKDRVRRLILSLMRPFLNLLRMHIIIILLIILYFCNLNNFIVYVVVYIIYFFPWVTVFKLTKKA